jgi:hypothetical protein
MSLETTNPINGKKIQVTLQDLGLMNWFDANKACAALGRGWRLPTMVELEVMYKELHLKGKGNFRLGGHDFYWSSTEWQYDPEAWLVDFANGYSAKLPQDDNNQVRAVRDL